MLIVPIRLIEEESKVPKTLRPNIKCKISDLAYNFNCQSRKQLYYLELI